MARPARPLEGVRVLDFSTLLPGPMASLILAEAGADVIKVERPQGEEMRRYQPRWGGEAADFCFLNRGKKSIAVDLKDEAARAPLMTLIARADVLVEQFRPGVMERLGLGYEALREINRRLVYCSISGYGAHGPRSQDAGHDLNYIAETGLLALSLGDPRAPTVPPALMADIGGGTYPAVINILLALLGRERTGEGCHLDIAMTDHMFTLAWWALAQGEVTGKWPQGGQGLLTGGSPRYRLYPTRDGRHAAVAALEQKFWERFCAAIGLEAPLWDDSRDAQATGAAVAAIIGGETAEHWAGVFAQADCCANIVRPLDAAVEDPHFRGRGLFDHILENGEGGRVAALPVPVVRQFRGGTGERRAAPRLGADNALLGDNDER